VGEGETEVSNISALPFSLSALLPLSHSPTLPFSPSLASIPQNLASEFAPRITEQINLEVDV
jgi:hypothetical protein